MANVEDFVSHQVGLTTIFKSMADALEASEAKRLQVEEDLTLFKLSYASLNAARSEESGIPFAVVLIDGDGCIFKREAIAGGRDGGRDMAGLLLKRIIAIVGNKIDILVKIFLNTTGLRKVMIDLGVASHDTFNEFMYGFTAAHPAFIVVDCGKQKEAADAKIRYYSSHYGKMPSCTSLFIGCGHDGGYSSMLQSLETEGRADKIKIVKSYTESAFEVRRLGFAEVEFQGVFEAQKLVVGSFHSSSTPKKSASFTNGYVSAGGYLSGKETKGGGYTSGKETKSGGGGGYVSRKEAKITGYSSAKEGKSTPTPKPAKVSATSIIKSSMAASKISVASPTPTVSTSKFDKSFVKKEEKATFVKVILRKLDPTKSISKNVPPPCNNKYLSPDGCTRPDCKYEHNYQLSSKEKKILRLEAKKSPCADALKGKSCPNPESCIGGHQCPWGAKCGYGATCRFTHPSMHPPKPSAVAAGGKRKPVTSEEDESDDYETDTSSDE